MEAFARRYTEHVLVRVDAYLEHIRQHPLTTRRYYNKVGY